MKNIIYQNKSEFDELLYLRGTLLRLGLTKMGLYVGQPVMLRIVSNNPGLTQKELSIMAGIKPSTVNVMLSRMAKNDLIEIKKDEGNLKLSRVYATKKGEQLAKKSDHFKAKLDEITYKNLTDEEIENFKNILTKMNANLKKELEKEDNNEDAEISKR